MYGITTKNKRAEKQFQYYLKIRQSIQEALNRLKEDPRNACGAHKLHGHLEGRWSCWLGSNISMVYWIDDDNQTLVVVTVGTHKDAYN